MEPNSDIAQLVEVIRKEHRSTRRVFGLSIIIVAVVLALIAPGIIRIESQDEPLTPGEDMLMTPEEVVTQDEAASATTSPETLEVQ